MNVRFFKNFSNYYNRIAKVNRNNLSAYPIPNYVSNEVNINEEDSVKWTQVFNFPEVLESDYALICEGTEILSRWFVIESKRNRKGQYVVNFRRDLISDFYDSIKRSPIYMNKAYLEYNDPMILNSEGMTFNQIKKSETLLKRNSDFPWLAVYFTKNFDLSGMYKDGAWQYPFTIDPNSAEPYEGQTWLWQRIEGRSFTNDGTYATKAELPFYSLNNRRVLTNNNEYKLRIPARYFYSRTQDEDNYWDGYISTVFTLDHQNYNDFEFERDDSVTPDIEVLMYYDEETGRWYDDMGEINTLMNNSTFIDNVINLADIESYDDEELMNLNGKFFYCEETRRYYEYHVTQVPIEASANLVKTVGNATALNRYIDENLYDKGLTDTYLTNKAFPKQLSKQEDIRVEGNTIKLEIIEHYVYPTEHTESIYCPINETFGNNHDKLRGTDFKQNNHTNEAYDILMLPYTDLKFSDCVVPTSKEQMLKIASNIIGSDSVIKDIQLVPYAPFEYEIVNGEIVMQGDYDELPFYRGFNLGREKVTKGFFLRNTNFTKTFNHNISYDDKKIANECDFYRLCSPNYNGVFEFNPAQFTFNNDNNPITTFNVDVALKPYQPYIHVYPNFSGLYGANYGDARGLICEGDFSLSRLSDAFTTYALQNKNYDAQFRRQIKNMKVSHKYDMIEQGIQGTVGAAVGAGAGLKIAGPVGAGIGAAAGVAEGVGNMALSGLRYKEQKSFAKDNYNLSLGNIQATPDTLTKVSTLTQNNKLFPFIEYYTCSFAEKEALRLKLKYDGMTVNRIDFMYNFTKKIDNLKYFKGELIKLDNAYADYELALAIADEIMKGVFIDEH